MAKEASGGKKSRKPRINSKKWEKYKVDGNSAKPIQRFCPRCGPGIFMAVSAGRLFCGKCHYTEFVKGQ